MMSWALERAYRPFKNMSAIKLAALINLVSVVLAETIAATTWYSLYGVYGPPVLVTAGIVTIATALPIITLVIYLIKKHEAATREHIAGLERQKNNLKETADQLARALDVADRANRSKSEFLATMSHELRTPLNAVIGFSLMIKDESCGPVGSNEYRDYAGHINSAAQHLLDLITDILDLSKLEAGREVLQEEVISVPDVIESARRLVFQRRKETCAELELDICDDLPWLFADERKLKQILVNLLSNAFKFTEADGRVTLRVWCRPDSGFVIQVEDSGIGISPDDIPKALSQFVQIDSRHNRKYAGTGLGLPLAKALVERHGGSLDLQSRPGVGSTVTLRFPTARIRHPSHDRESPLPAARVAS